MKIRKLYLVCLLCVVFTYGYGQSQEPGYIGSPKLYYGVAYYPEAWNLETVDEDIRQMQEYHINVVRVGEFSWAMMEPNEGEYDFEWLHYIIDKCYANGIDVVLGTPSATPPIWMAEKYPEIFQLNENGIRKGHGARRNCSYTHPVYRELSEKITLEMAKEFGEKPGVIGWQTDNEFNIIYDYSDYTKELWHKWLEDKYKTIDNLNGIWRTNLWSQKYHRFDQVPMPGSNVWHHTSLQLEWDRFSDDQIVDFQKLQIDAIRKYSSLPITHDGMPGQRINYPNLFEELDFMAVNAYHSFPVYNRVQTNYDRMRGYGKKSFWLFETAPNNSGGGNDGSTWFIHQPDGSMRAALWMNFALGGQGAMFWLWRQQPAGQEMPHGAILSAWGAPSANSKDLKQLGAELKQHSDLLINAPVEKARIALFYSHDNDKGLRIEKWSNELQYYPDWTRNFYTPVSDAFLHRDVIHEGIDLDQYDVLVAPLMPIITKELSARLATWVENGGTLIYGPMTGYRDEYWASHTDKALGWLEEWTGISVKSRIPIDKFNEDYDSVPAVVSNSHFISTPEGVCSFWSEAAESSTGKVLAQYKNGMHRNLPAIIENQVGKGKVVFMGTYPGVDIYQEMIVHYAGEKDIAPLAQGDNNVLVVPRIQKDNSRLYFVINLNNHQSKFSISERQYMELFTGQTLRAGDMELEPFEIKLLKEK